MMLIIICFGQTFTSQLFHFKDLDSSSDEEEDFQSNRNKFQASRSVSSASKKSISFFDMELGNKDDNIRHAVPFVRQITEDGKAKLEIYRPTTNPIYIYTQVCSFD
jgi:facilitated trehalose transporter